MSLRLALGGLLDRYVARLFVASYLSAFFLVVGLFLIIDMATNLDDYLSAGPDGSSPSILAVGKYYALQLPFLYLQMSPYVTLVAGMFTGARMTRHREIVAGLNAGLSARRLFLPAYVGAGLLCLGMFGLRELATTRLGEERDLLYDRLKEKRERPVLEKFVVLTDDGPVFVEAFHPGDPADPEAEPLIEGLSYHYRRGERRVSLVADEARPLPGGRWELEGGRRLVSSREGQTETVLDVLDEVRFEPEDCTLSWKGRERAIDLSFSETITLLNRDPANVRFRTLLHEHITLPLAGFVLLMVGLPFALSTERGKGAERVAMGFFLCLIYFAAAFLFRTVGLEGQLAPLYAGWIPTLGFGSLGVVLTASMRT